MVKKLMLIAIMAFLSMPIVARNAIKVVCGDLSVFNNPNITASVLFDYEDLRIEGKPYMEHLRSRGNDFVRDWPQESTTSENYFIKCWNHDNEDGMQVTSSPNQDYIMVFDVSDMDMGSGAASMFVGFGAGGATMSAKMYIFKKGNNIPVLVVNINGQSGRSGMTEIVRRVDLYGELAEDLVETLQKTKQSKLPASTKEIIIPSLCQQSTSANHSKPVGQKQPVQESQMKKSNPQSVILIDNRIDFLKQIKGENISYKRRNYIGNFNSIASQERISVYLDFSNAKILNRSESDFIKYMETSTDDGELDPNFANNWINKIQPNLLSIFCGEVNKELRDEDLSLRFTSEMDNNYVLKLEVLELDDDGNNIINFLFVNMQTGKVDAQIKCYSDGGRFGEYVGLLNQGFESAGENFSEVLLDQID